MRELFARLRNKNVRAWIAAIFIGGASLFSGCSIDKEPPKLELLGYTPNRNPQVLNLGETLTFTMRFTDNKALQNYEVSVAQPNGVTLFSKAETISGTLVERTFSVPITAQTVPGIYYLKAVVYDQERLGVVSAPSPGNVWLMMTINNTPLDTDPPVLVVASPQSGATFSAAALTKINVNGNITDALSDLNNEVKARLVRLSDGAEVENWFEIIPPQKKSFDFSVDIPIVTPADVPPGDYEVRVEAADKQNNIAKKSVSIKITE